VGRIACPPSKSESPHLLIDANRIGWAASGRNGGFVDASLTRNGEWKGRWPNEI